MKVKTTCPACHESITIAVLTSDLARGLAKRVKTHSGGRPRSSTRCQCGELTLARAMARGGKQHNASKCILAD
jgi:hypothetical protein